MACRGIRPHTRHPHGSPSAAASHCRGRERRSSLTAPAVRSPVARKREERGLGTVRSAATAVLQDSRSRPRLASSRFCSQLRPRCEPGVQEATCWSCESMASGSAHDGGKRPAQSPTVQSVTAAQTSGSRVWGPAPLMERTSRSGWRQPRRTSSPPMRGPLVVHELMTTAEAMCPAVIGMK